EASVQGKSEKAEVVDFLPGGRDLHATERLVSVTEPTTPRPLEPDRSKADTGKIDLAESAAVTPVEQQATPSVAEQGPQVEEIRVWEEALRNKSPIIRKQAARMLKKLTGKDYDY
ncbi:hypothetical protein FJY63_11705, partial [Candidatus Sumerlaeota bacterium]|nr:hypothetical protein [Candidatus Sumerlaeota bacterium]